MEIDDASAKEEGERAASAARNLATSTLDIWLVRCAVLVIVALQFLVANDLTLLPRWIMPSLELALLLPLSIATAWSIGATKKAAAADNPSDFWEIVARHRNMIRRAFLFLTGLVSIANLLSLAGLVQAIVGGHAGSGNSLLIDSLNIWATNIIIFFALVLEPRSQESVDRDRASARVRFYATNIAAHADTTRLCAWLHRLSLLGVHQRDCVFAV